MIPERPPSSLEIWIKGSIALIGICAMFVEAVALENGDLHTGIIAFLVVVIAIMVTKA